MNQLLIQINTKTSWVTWRMCICNAHGSLANIGFTLHHSLIDSRRPALPLALCVEKCLTVGLWKLTIQLSSLNVNFIDGLRQRKLSLIQYLHHDSFTKVVLFFRNDVWITEAMCTLTLVIFALMEDTSGNVRYPPPPPPHTHPVAVPETHILCSFGEVPSP